MSHPISQALHTSKIGAEIATKKSNMLVKPTPDALSWLDEAIQGFFSNLACTHSAPAAPVDAADSLAGDEEKTIPHLAARSPATQTDVELEVGDRVRLKKGVRTSSVEMSFRESSNRTASQLCLGECTKGKVGIVVHKSQPWRTGDACREQVFVVASSHRSASTLNHPLFSVPLLIVETMHTEV